MRLKKVAAKYDERSNKVLVPFSDSLDTNIRNFEELFTDCGDLVKRKFPIGKNKDVWAYIAYIDVMTDRRVIEESVLEQLLVQVRGVGKSLPDTDEDKFSFIKDGGFATADLKDVNTMDDAVLAVLSGDTVIFIDGYEKCIVVSTKGFPNRGVQQPDTENVIRGSKEGFTEAFRINTVLIRRRIRDSKLKVKQIQLGTRTRTDVALMYLDDLVRPQVLKEIEERLSYFKIDSVLESGTLEQLIETNWYSPFPQTQVTQRPDKVASAILEGRVAIVVDNTPFVLLLPTTMNCFFQSSEDYYQRWYVMSFVRVLRYCAAFLSFAIPGFYLALTTFHPAMIPTSLTFSIAAAREGVPFPALIEVLIMELAFELLREAGVRLPTPIGNTIGIVGGLIIGQAVVEANLVSPIIVIIVALTAISSFAIPSYSLTSAFRIIKYLIIFLSAFLGFLGFWLGILIILTHLVSLKSIDIPYLSPFTAREVNNEDLQDSLIRMPIFVNKLRPVFARRGSKVRLDIDEKGEKNVFTKQ
ncbi:spore germination protein [Vallitalea longa]|uniref:Spore germination protein n=1 Tax=Vallitalea longa TaxID=2936439 RepID=A0A9W5Y8M8_9FIRM|nr:spore germination protein [Vallitalea longa]GKX28544.1 spore germination protein [Vallitalea longa]